MDIEKLAKLSSLDKEDVRTNKNLLVSILDAFKEVKHVDTKKVTPLINPTEPTNLYREDKVNQQTTKEDFLKNAPDKIGRCFKVPFKL